MGCREIGRCGWIGDMDGDKKKAEKKEEMGV